MREAVIACGRNDEERARIRSMFQDIEHTIPNLPLAVAANDPVMIMTLIKEAVVDPAETISGLNEELGRLEQELDRCEKDRESLQDDLDACENEID